MKVIRDDIWLCVDCLMVACNGDTSGIESDERVAEVEAGLEKLGPGLVPDFDSEAEDDNGILEFSWHGCDCCGSRLGGELHRFATLGDGDEDPEPSGNEDGGGHDCDLCGVFTPMSDTCENPDCRGMGPTEEP